MLGAATSVAAPPTRGSSGAAAWSAPRILVLSVAEDIRYLKPEKTWFSTKKCTRSLGNISSFVTCSNQAVVFFGAPLACWLSRYAESYFCELGALGMEKKMLYLSYPRT
jgi:hypothetical protein